MLDSTTKPKIRKGRPALAVISADAVRRKLHKEKVRAIHVKDEFFRAARDDFDYLLKAIEDDHEEMQAIVLRGPTGAGKSHILKHLMKDVRLKPRKDEFGEIRLIQYVRAPSPCNLATLGGAIYTALTGDQLNSRTATPDVWVRARAALYNRGVVVLVIDEMHHAFLNNARKETKKLVETLKGLLLGQIDPSLDSDVGVLPPSVAQYPIGLVLAGMPWLKKVIETDLQFNDRCFFQTITPFGSSLLDEKAMQSFLDHYANTLGFTVKPQFSDADMRLRFRKATNSYRGRMARLIKKAAFLAINRGLTKPDWRMLLAEVFEKSYEVGDARNPFLVADPKNLGRIKEIEQDRSTLLEGRKKPEDQDDGD
jgi:hypothetical protein